MEKIAHRACAGQFPENTVKAAQSCASHVDRIELDVRRCGSDELVVFHDDNLEMLTSVSGRVHALDMASLTEIEVLGSDQTIPTLSMVLEVIPPTVDIQIDFKHLGLAHDVKDILANFEHDVYVCSVHDAALNQVHEEGWDVPIGYVSFPYFQERPVSDYEISGVDYRKALKTATELKCKFIEVPQKLCRQTDIIVEAHDAGLDVVAWTIDTHEVAEALAHMGVDALMVNRYDVI